MFPTRVEPRHLLIVDDSIDDVFLFSRLIQRAGIRNPLQIVHDGDEAIERLSKARPDSEFPLPLAIFTDLKMPRCDGFEFLRWIRRQERLRSVLTIVISSSDLPKDIARAFRLGCHAYVQKFLSPEDCRKVVSAAEALSAGLPMPELPGFRSVGVGR